MANLNKLTDSLLEEIDRLMDAEDESEIEKECKRSKALTDISKTVLNQTRLTLDIIVARDRMNSDTERYAAGKMLPKAVGDGMD